MNVKIGEAAHDERGAFAYGEPGNQTGEELRIIDFYNNPARPWQKVFRAKSQEVRDKLALAMRQACANMAIGYAQYGDGTTPYKDRYGLSYAVDNDTPSHTIPDVKVPCNVDCSALVAQCCRAAGIYVPSTMRTATECATLMGTGAFDEYTYYDGFKLLEGDIMWLQGHTAIITSVTDYNTTPKWIGEATAYCSVYSTPNLNGSLLPGWPHLGKGNLVDVCDEDGKFWYVRIAGKYFGFVLKSFIENANPEPQPTPTPTPVPTGFPWLGIVQTAVNLRTSPKNLGVLNYCNIECPAGTPIRHILRKGEEVTVIGESGGWWQVQIIGRYTWTPWCAKKDGTLDIIKRV